MAVVYKRSCISSELINSGRSFEASVQNRLRRKPSWHEGLLINDSGKAKSMSVSEILKNVVNFRLTCPTSLRGLGYMSVGSYEQADPYGQSVTINHCTYSYVGRREYITHTGPH